ncbi:formyltransferase family protein [Halodesulfovibrio aestuarii]|uniref:Methionyl-tRNA formyltransferase n=1 Tax=Halodesulfovibrio aestuarii TaxID=126333 RepID=A0A8G2C7D4_9BACT|nr:formyltransferase family protein [Halodesulfovibrio aestuarii]SHI61577.1 methionyl-tRNA formyltransferase [Halodesulfovibrio aestuarii]
MRVIIIGQGWLAAEVLKGISAVEGVKVIAVTSERCGDRFAKAANDFNVPLIATLGDLPDCDVILAAHCHRFVSRVVRDKAKHGVLAYHPSLLPRHRGKDAIHWTLAMKDSIAGGTVYKVDDGADTGEIIAQDWCHVAADDTPQSLWRRALAPMGVRLLIEAITQLKNTGQLSTQKQDESYATWEPSLSRFQLKYT